MTEQAGDHPVDGAGPVGVLPPAPREPADAVGTEVEIWTAFYDRVEQALMALAGRMVGGEALSEPGWEFLPPPPGPLPAELVTRHDRALARLALITEATEGRFAALRKELDTLPHHAVADHGTIAVGRALDVFG